jgi:probable rRNA maturation factor
MNIQIIQDQQDLQINSTSVEKLVADFLKFHDLKYDEAAIHFVNTPTICDLHADFFDDPSTTDCISFPMDDQDDDDGYRVLGEVFVCPETAIHYVKSNGGDVYQELTLYTVHGLLHLIGYDDIEDEDRVLMRKEETRYLEHVSSQGLWIKKSKDK